MMKRLAVLLGLMMVLLVFGLPAVAQEGAQQVGGQQQPADPSAMWLIITSGFAMAIASSFCGIGQARAAAAACEGLARNPGAAPAIRFALILALVLIESLALYTFAILLILKFVG